MRCTRMRGSRRRVVEHTAAATGSWRRRVRLRGNDDARRAAEQRPIARRLQPSRPACWCRSTPASCLTRETRLARTMEGVERWKLYAGGAAISVATLYLLRRATKRTGPPPPAWTPSAPGTCVAHLRTIPVSIRLSHQYARRRHCVPCASRLSDACGRVVVGRSREAITAYGRDAVGMWRRRPPWVAAVEV